MDKWKIKREIKRIKSQLFGILSIPTDRVKQILHDSSRPGNLKIHQGKIPPKRKVAIFLIYQPNEFQRSIHTTCQHLLENNYSTLIVSNSKIPDEEKRQLLENCWMAVERPNFGYDFGGYRDGIWLLNHWKTEIDNLIIINDSIWYPVYENDRTIEQMEISNAQFVGAVKIDPPPLSMNQHKRPSFYASFFWHFKSKAIESREFQDFWSQYKLTNNKPKTIKYGERGLCYKIFNSNISHGYIFSREIFDKLILDLNNKEVANEILSKIISPNTKNNREIENVRKSYEKESNTEAWIEEAKKTIQAATEKQNIYSTALPFLIKSKLINFIKKANDPGNNAALEKLIELMDEDNIEHPQDTILEEIKKIKSQRIK